MAIYNYVEDLVYSKILDLLSKKPEVCRCDKCIDDMAALALAGLPVIPYVTPDGGVFRQVQNMTNDKLKIEVATRCIRALETVKNNSKHKKQSDFSRFVPGAGIK
ncbi:MAG: late competence development ComFB family protein [Candidatus Wallbacteria bacterium]